MAEFRRNHGSGGALNGMLIRVTIFIGFTLLLFVLYSRGVFSEGNGVPDETFYRPDKAGVGQSKDYVITDFQDSRFYPTTNKGYIVEHEYFSLSYSERDEQPEWVAYKLTEDQLRADNVRRRDYFEEDPAVRTGSANYYDYKGSGYSKGHLVPSADRNFSENANYETFFMSNMSPQIRGFNSGIWNELEITARKWTYDHDEVYIVSGPILTDRGLDHIGRENEVTVPERYYKIIYDLSESDDPDAAIAFILPNEVSEKSLSEYVVTIDEIEEATGLDFFTVLPDSFENKLEKNTDTDQWPFYEDIYYKRVKQWNRQ